MSIYIIPAGGGDKSNLRKHAHDFSNKPDDPMPSLRS